MGVTDAFRRLAVRRAHVLLVEAPGGLVVRVRTEHACARRGWIVVAAPADADALLVCGPRSDEDAAGTFGDAVEAVWAQLPGPRARGGVVRPDEVEDALDRLRDDLLTWRAERDPVAPIDMGVHDMGDMDHSDMDHGQMDHGDMGEHDMGDMGDMDHGEMDHGDMGGMDHGHMDMGGPAGIPLASGADDRDGLEMDETHLRLGPVLAGWPAGLAVWCTLHGDLVTAVEVESVPSPREPADEPSALDAPSEVEARRLDALAVLLDLAGARHEARLVRSRRDQALDGPPASTDDLRRRLSRSRVLAWSLRDLGVVTAEAAAEQGWPTAWHGDAYDRLLRLADPAPRSPLVPIDQVAAALPHLMSGLDLGAARLVAAGLVEQSVASGATASDRDPAGVSA